MHSSCRRRPEIRRRQNGRQDQATDERSGEDGRDGDEEQQPPGQPRIEPGAPVDGQPVAGHRGRAGVPRGRRLVDRLPGGRVDGRPRVPGRGRLAATDPVAAGRRRPVNGRDTTPTEAPSAGSVARVSGGFAAREPDKYRYRRGPLQYIYINSLVLFRRSRRRPV